MSGHPGPPPATPARDDHAPSTAGNPASVTPGYRRPGLPVMPGCRRARGGAAARFMPAAEQAQIRPACGRERAGRLGPADRAVAGGLGHVQGTFMHRPGAGRRAAGSGPSPRRTCHARRSTRPQPMAHYDQNQKEVSNRGPGQPASAATRPPIRPERKHRTERSESSECSVPVQRADIGGRLYRSPSLAAMASVRFSPPPPTFRRIGVNKHGDGGHAAAPGQRVAMAPRRIKAQRVHHRGQAAAQPRRHYLVKQGKSVGRCIQVVLAATYQRAQPVR